MKKKQEDLSVQKAEVLVISRALHWAIASPCESDRSVEAKNLYQAVHALHSVLRVQRVQKEESEESENKKVYTLCQLCVKREGRRRGFTTKMGNRGIMLVCDACVCRIEAHMKKKYGDKNLGDG